MRTFLPSIITLAVLCEPAGAQLLNTNVNAQPSRPVLVADLLPGVKGQPFFPNGQGYAPNPNFDNDYFNSGVPRSYLVFKGKLVFAAGNEDSCSLYTYDGISTPVRYPYNNIFTRLGNTAVINDELYFENSDNWAGQSGKFSLYKWDGINQPVRVSDVVPANHGSSYSNINSFAVLNNKLYFLGDNDSVKFALFEHDPQTGVTTRLSKSFTTAKNKGGNSLQYTTAYKGRIYFLAPNEATGFAVYMYDPATGNISTLDGLAKPNETVFVTGMQVQDDVLYLLKDASLYGYDGVNAPQRLTQEGFPYIFVADAVENQAYKDGRLYFPGSTGNGNDVDLWYYDAKTKQAARAVDLLPGKYSLVQYLSVYKDNIVFDVKHNYDHEPTETYFYNVHTGESNIMPHPSESNPWFTTSERIEYKGSLLMTGNDGTCGIELYKYDEASNSSGFMCSLFPNPAIDQLNVQFNMSDPQHLTLRITDVVGRYVYGQSNDYDKGITITAINTGGMAQGNYYCTIYNSANYAVWTGKFVKL